MRACEGREVGGRDLPSVNVCVSVCVCMCRACSCVCERAGGGVGQGHQQHCVSQKQCTIFPAEVGCMPSLVHFQSGFHAMVTSRITIRAAARPCTPTLPTHMSAPGY